MNELYLKASVFYMFSIIFLTLKSYECQFIKAYNRIMLYEINNLNEQFNYVVDATDKCAIRNEMDNPDNDYLIDLNVTVLMYKSYNSNVRYMLQIDFKLLKLESEFKGFEIKIGNQHDKKSICITITPTNYMLALNDLTKEFRFILKDPQFQEFNEPNKYVFYFGKVTVRTLGMCDQVMVRTKRPCVLQKSNTIDAGILNLNNDNIQNYKQDPNNECYVAPIFDTCGQVYRTPNQETYVILIHPMPDFIDVINHQPSRTHPYPYIYAYQNESLNGLIYKIYTVQNGYIYRYTSLFEKPSESNPCKNYTDRKFCVCDNKCDPCYSNDPKIEEHILSMHVDTKTNSLYKSKSCSTYPFTSIPIDKLQLKTEFQNSPIDTDQGYRLSERLPQLCTSLTTNKKIKFSDQTYSYELSISFNDSYFVSKTKLVDLILDVKLYYICNNDTSPPISTNESIQYCSVFLKSQEFIDPNEEIVFNELHIGHYVIEITPNVKSSDCGSLCPFIPSVSDINIKFEKFMCESCKKLLHFFHIGQDDTQDNQEPNSKFTCFDVISKKRDFRKEDFGINSEIDEILLSVNQTFLVNSDFPLLYPANILEDQLCKSFEIVKDNTLKRMIIYYSITSFLCICLALAIFFIISKMVFNHYVKHFQKTNVLIVLSIEMNPNEQYELRSKAEDFSNKLKRAFNHLNTQIIGFHTEINSQDEVVTHLEHSDVIIYVANSQHELDDSLSLLNNGITEIKIGTDIHYDVYYELFLNNEFNSKLQIITFNEKIIKENMKTSISSSNGNTNLNYFVLPKDYIQLFENICHRSKRSKCWAKDIYKKKLLTSFIKYYMFISLRRFLKC